MTADELRQRLTYDPQTGTFTWLAKPGDERLTKTWNARFAGKQAGSIIGQYLTISLNNVVYYGHRLAWLYMHGEWPAQEIDHVNLDKKDCRLANLRQATSTQNKAHRPKLKTNTSGYKGAYRCPHTGRWFSSIERHGVYHYLGRFDTAEEAAAAYRAKSKELDGDFSHD